MNGGGGALPGGVSKVKYCRYYAKDKTCFYGDECQFLHEDPNNGAASASLGLVVNNNHPGLGVGAAAAAPGAGGGGGGGGGAAGGGGGGGGGGGYPHGGPKKNELGSLVEPGQLLTIPGLETALPDNLTNSYFSSSFIGVNGFGGGPAEPKYPLIQRQANSSSSPSLLSDCAKAYACAGHDQLNLPASLFSEFSGLSISQRRKTPNPAANEFIPKGGSTPRLSSVSQSNMSAFSPALFSHPSLGSPSAAGLAPGFPTEVDNYHSLFPLEPPPASRLQKTSNFGFITSCYKAINSKDDLPYCLRRIHGFRLVNTKCMVLVDMWKKIQHSNTVTLREVFTTKAFGEHSLVFAYDFHAGAETMMNRHFNDPSADAYFTKRKWGQHDGPLPRQHAGLLPESLIWAYIVQLSSALRTIHTAGLACRAMDPTKILITGKTRLRVNCVGIFDVLTFDSSQNNPLGMMPQYQQADLISLGKVVLALACNSVAGIQRENLQKAMELVSLNYSSDLKNLILYLLTDQNRLRSVNDIMPMIGARFYTQLDAAQMRNDVIEDDLMKEVQNGRLFRLLAKLGTINERPEFQKDPTWSETGDRYLLKLFRDHLFHQLTEAGTPWIDLSHIVSCLNKLDAGVPEKISLVSRDEKSVLVVTYADLKRCFESAFSELLAASNGQL
ncbi:PAN2-PAN3 deadenylation complex subunit PAN3 isoform X2 [Carcharodon carcharias]|uniref:PAN2-PAN3 deadenylation complex subunit PAN3 isoform X2 n=1 Tax=Carcharodon carcharias TaxID=13397 RepID=UPI001B7F6DAD|nr:PAN2-PAN3 deadenylation complex subunit PAN3 isoform X2 [Carcharodon carcharias]